MHSRRVTDIKSHTSLRGIAALLVVAFHYRDVFDLDRYTRFFAGGYVWVDFFFILSGYILCHVYQPDRLNTSEFLRARFARVYPLHLAALLFLVGLQISIPVIFHRPFNVGHWSTLWLNVLNVHAWGFLSAYDWNFPSWSISAEFAAYLVFPLLSAALVRAPKLTTTIMVTAIIARAVAFPNHDDWERTVLLRCLPMFFLGMLLYRSRDAAVNAHYLPAIQAASVIGICTILHLGLSDSLLIVPFAALVFSTQTDRGNILTAKPLVYLGLWSYSIYLLHIPIKILSEQVGPKFGVGVWPTAISALTATLVLGAVSFHYFETPARLLLRRKSAVDYQAQVKRNG